MDEAINKLREIGAQKIYEQTHISRGNIEAILDQTFTGMTPVQVSGFISILEREYGVDLSGLKKSVVPETDDLSIKISFKVDNAQDDASAGHLEKEQRSWKWVVGLSLVAVVIAVFMMSGDDKDEQRMQEQVPVATQTLPADDTQAVSDEQSEVLDEAVSEDDDQNVSRVGLDEEPEEEVVQAPVTTYFTIAPRARLWMGIIDLSNRKRRVEITKERVDLNASKPWLLVFGHGHFDIENGEQELKFKRQSKVRVLFEDGLASEIDIEEYKARNRGRNW